MSKCEQLYIWLNQLVARLWNIGQKRASLDSWCGDTFCAVTTLHQHHGPRRVRSVQRSWAWPCRWEKKYCLDNKFFWLFPLQWQLVTSLRRQIWEGMMFKLSLLLCCAEDAVWVFLMFLVAVLSFGGRAATLEGCFILLKLFYILPNHGFA